MSTVNFIMPIAQYREQLLHRIRNHKDFDEAHFIMADFANQWKLIASALIVDAIAETDYNEQWVDNLICQFINDEDSVIEIVEELRTLIGETFRHTLGDKLDKQSFHVGWDLIGLDRITLTVDDRETYHAKLKAVGVKDPEAVVNIFFRNNEPFTEVNPVDWIPKPKTEPVIIEGEAIVIDEELIDADDPQF